MKACLKKNEGFVYKKLLDKRKKIKPKFQVNDHVRVADWSKTFSKRDTINWSSKVNEISEIFIDTLPKYHIDNLKERYNEALLKKTELTMKEKRQTLWKPQT